MERELDAFIRAGRELSANWDNDRVHNYPAYLPDFDEFIEDLTYMLDDPLAGRPDDAPCGLVGPDRHTP